MKKILTIVTSAVLALSLTACGESPEEKAKRISVKAQSLGCITTDESLEYQRTQDPRIQQEIDVCLQRDKDVKSAQYQQRRHEENMAYYQAEALDELDDITENLAYGVSRPVAPIQPGVYRNNIGNEDCGEWIGGYWYWDDEDSRCAVETRRYNDYLVATGVITAGALATVRSYDYYDSYRKKAHYTPTVNVKNYYGTSGKVINQSTYNNQFKTYKTNRNNWEVKRNEYKKSAKYKTALTKANSFDTKYKSTTVNKTVNKVTNTSNTKFKSNFATTNNKPTVTKTNNLDKDKTVNKVTNTSNTKFKSNFATTNNKPTVTKTNVVNTNTVKKTVKTTTNNGSKFKSNFSSNKNGTVNKNKKTTKTKTKKQKKPEKKKKPKKKSSSSKKKYK